MNISIYPPLSIHEIGQRDNQEDALAQWDNRLFVLCDGMGGHEKGEVASQTVCQSLVNWFEEHINPDDSFTDDQLRAAIEYAFTELDKYSNGNPRQMGTTLALLYIHNQGVTAAHMGDSRIYQIGTCLKYDGPHGIPYYISRDHSLAFDLFQAGEITYEEMLTFPQKNIVTRAMTPGEDNRMRPDVIHLTSVLPEQYFFMCSDGMLEHMDNHQLVNLLTSSIASDEKKRQQLISATSKNNDNHSAWIIHIKDVVHEKGDDVIKCDEQSEARYNMLNIIPYDKEKTMAEALDTVNNTMKTDGDGDVVIIEEATKKKSFIQRLSDLFF